MPRKVLIGASPEPCEDGSIQVEVMLPVRQRRRENDARTPPGPISTEPSRLRIPRITRLMALAIKFQEMVDRGEVRDYAELARLGYVTRARVTQIMNMLLLAPDIQEALLQRASDVDLTERDMRRIGSNVLWREQRRAVGRTA